MDSRTSRTAFRLLATVGLAVAGAPLGASAQDHEAENTRHAVAFENLVAATADALALYDSLRGVSRREFVAKAGAGGHRDMAGQSFDRVEAYGNEVAATVRQGTDNVPPKTLADLNTKAGALLVLVDKLKGDYLNTDWLTNREPKPYTQADALGQFAIAGVSYLGATEMLTLFDPQRPAMVRNDELRHVKSGMAEMLVGAMDILPANRGSATAAIAGNMEKFVNSACNEESLARSVIQLGAANVPALPSARFLMRYRLQMPDSILKAARRLKTFDHEVKFLQRPESLKNGPAGPA